MEVAENKCVQQLFLNDIKIKCKEKQGTPLNTLHFKTLLPPMLKSKEDHQYFFISKDFDLSL